MQQRKSCLMGTHGTAVKAPPKVTQPASKPVTNTVPSTVSVFDPAASASPVGRPSSEM